MNITNLIGWLGAILVVSAFWSKHDWKLNILLGLGLFLMGCHFYQMGATTAAFNCWIGGARSLISLKWPSRSLMIVASILALMIAIPTWNGYLSMLAIVGALGTNYILYRESGIRLRLLFLIINALFFIQDIVIGSLPALIMETCCAFGNIYVARSLGRLRPPVILEAVSLSSLS
jgi:hypothetical protein